MSTSPTTMPVYQDFMNPTLAVLRNAGQSLSIEDLDSRVLNQMALPEEVTSVPHDPLKPDRSEVSYRLAWARSYLKKAGMLDNPKRGSWTLTEEGRSAGEIDSRALASRVAQAAREERSATGTQDASTPHETPFDTQEEDEELRTGRVSDQLVKRLLEVRQQMIADGSLLSRNDINRCYARFRERFGPDILVGLDGERLLTTMHGRGSRDSLVYWLEFKNDDEFPARFGSIGGGSALKFGIYQSAESGRWMTGTGKSLTPLSIEEAIQRARSHRDQLVAGSNVLRSLEAAPANVDFSDLQTRMAQVAPELAESSWGHKYFSLMAPTLIEPIHGTGYQRYQLVKMLKMPADGRYENARIFVGVARQLDLTLHELGAVLARCHGNPHAYWRIGTTAAGESEWPRMRDGGFMAIGWSDLGDLSEVEHNKAHKDQLRAQMNRAYPHSNPAVVTKKANEVFNFVTRPHERDIVLAMDGAKVRGIGRVAGNYYFQDGDGPFPHRRPVEWLRVNDWKLPQPEGLRTTFVPFKKHSVNLIEAEARLLGVAEQAPRASPPSPSVAPSAPPRLAGLLARMQSILSRKRQLILYGPPGTGKTYWAERAARELAARSWFQQANVDLDDRSRQVLRRDGAVELCAFHPAYGYEDFLEGYRPTRTDQSLAFELRDGVFKQLCQRAAGHPGRNYYLIIDEINRGDIPRIFGELLTVLELSKRGLPITLPLSGQPLIVPRNVFLIGTMNTADRSIALLDAALRRRFGFVELMPDAAVLGSAVVGGIPLGAWLDALNRRVVAHAGRDARNLQVGHSYLMPGGEPVTDLARFAELLRDDIIPLLEEYCYEDFDALTKILGPRIVQRQGQRINEALFTAAGTDDLADAIVTEFAEISATTAAVNAESADDEEVEEEIEEGLDEDATDEGAAGEATAR